MAKCTECGAAVADDSRFCNYCGAKLNIIGEHLGTQILGNTQAIMGALERMAPGAAQQYTVLGTAGDGPLAGGIILSPPWTKGEGYRLFWSDGEKLTQVAADHIVGCFERGTFAVNPELIDTCPVCLKRYHRGRRVEGFWDITKFRAELAQGDYTFNPPRTGRQTSWDERFSQLAAARPHHWSGCPFCWSSALLSPEYRAYRIESQEQPLRMPVSSSEHNAKHYEHMAERGPRKLRKDARERAPHARWEAQVLASLLDDVENSVDDDREVFRAFVATLPSLQLQPPSSLADWTGFQRNFVVMAGEVALDTREKNPGFPVIEFRLSPSMSERARRALASGSPSA